LLVPDATLLPPALEPLFGTGHKPLESVERFRLEVLRVGRLKGPGKIAWFKISQRLHHCWKTHSNRMI
jgi:hypothetical protein